MQSSVRRADERGAVSVLGLFVLTAVLLLALGAVHFMRSGSVLASEYERETQLRLAAESGIETAAAQLEQSSKAIDDTFDVADVPVSEGIELHVVAEVQAAGQLHLIAVAIDTSDPHIGDGEGWRRGKLVRALMEKKGERYVWRRWF